MDQKVFPRIFGWMFTGLLVTFLTAMYVASNENMIYNIFVTNLYWFILLAEIGLVIFLSARVHKMQYMTGVITFLIYSLVSGLTFSVFFVIYELSSIISIFGITALIFGIFALIGYRTNVDLTKMSTLLFMFLVGAIIALIVNIFLQNDTLSIVLSWVMVAIFVGFTAYDIQKIKNMSYQVEDPKQIAIIGALQLYLDFINLFINLLRLFGKGRD